jgi:peptidoglycan L-alanyl-D-glutamate endopeptidase CwlK
MPRTLVDRINLDELHPDFVALLLQLLANCEQRGATYIAVSAYRSQSEQAKKYFQGRTQPGPIITNARPGWSFHNYGLAVDVVFDKDNKLSTGLQPEFTDNRAYTILKEEGEKLGLQVGVPSVPGGDPGHVQFKQPLKIAELKKAWNKTPNLKDVWKLIDVARQ